MRYLGVIAFFFCLGWIASCVKSIEEEYSHEKPQKQAAIGINDIIHYADSIDRIEARISKQKSLIYTRGDFTFHVERHIDQNKPVLYIGQSSGGEQGPVHTRLYLINGEPALLVRSSNNPRANRVRMERYIFAPTGTVAEYKEYASVYNAGTTPFIPLPNKTIDADAELATYENAMEQKGDFDLSFEGIAEYPKARYLILGKTGYNAYRSAILLETHDEFTDALATYPEAYRGKKLWLDWRIRNNNEMVYISGKFR